MLPFKQFNIAFLSGARVCVKFWVVHFKTCNDSIIYISNKLEGVTLMCVITGELYLWNLCVDILIESEQSVALKATDKFNSGASDSKFLFY